MVAALLLLAVSLQEDGFKVVADPARRAREADRAAAVKALEEKAGGSALHWAAAEFLKRHASSPASPAIDAFLRKHWTGAALDEKAHRAALDELAELSGNRDALQALRLLALPHLDALGRKVEAPAQRLGFTWVEGRWMAGEQTRLAEAGVEFRTGRRQAPISGAIVDGASGIEAAYGSYSTRYAATLAMVSRALAGDASCKDAWKALLDLTGGGPGSDAHVKALTAGYYKAATCEGCKGGKVTCSTCNGKRRADQKCPNCNGAGKLRPASAVGNTSIMIRCGACVGKGELKDASCFTCAQSGTVDCGSCNGKFWRDTCSGCILGKIECGTCKGKRQIEAKCPNCKDGRVVPDNDYGKLGFTQLCKRCSGRGKLFTPCETCKRGGQVECPGCLGKGRLKGFTIPAEKVYAPDSCRDCAGKGWRFAAVAVPCAGCHGLGSILRPAHDPSKLLGPAR